MTWHCLTPTRRPRHFSRAAQDPALGLPFPPNAISPPDTKPRVKTAERFGSTPNTTCLSGTKPGDKCVERFRVFYLTPFSLPEPKLPLQLFVYSRPLKDAYTITCYPPPSTFYNPFIPNVLSQNPPFCPKNFPSPPQNFSIPPSLSPLFPLPRPHPRNRDWGVSAPRFTQTRTGLTPIAVRTPLFLSPFTFL